LRHGTTGEQTVQVLVAALAGEIVVERRGRCPCRYGQTVVQAVLAQENDHRPMFVVEVEAFDVRQRGGFGAVPAVGARFRRAVMGVVAGRFGILMTISTTTNVNFCREFRR
jgi:hypothetical protein